MAVVNFICKTCLCANVCKIRPTFAKFDDEAKVKLPTNIQILNCDDYISVSEQE